MRLKLVYSFVIHVLHFIQSWPTWINFEIYHKYQGHYILYIMHNYGIIPLLCFSIFSVARPLGSVCPLSRHSVPFWSCSGSGSLTRQKWFCCGRKFSTRPSHPKSCDPPPPPRMCELSRMRPELDLQRSEWVRSPDILRGILAGNWPLRIRLFKNGKLTYRECNVILTITDRHLLSLIPENTFVRHNFVSYAIAINIRA